MLQGLRYRLLETITNDSWILFRSHFCF